VRVGQQSQEADAFMELHGLDQLFFITSENPSSKKWSDQSNLLFTTALMRDLVKDGIPAWPARAEPDSDWSNECGFFVSHRMPQIILMARKHEQNAIVMLPKGQAALLVLCQKI
jgi:hypothetical protein